MRPPVFGLAAVLIAFALVWSGVGLAISGGVGVGGTVTLDATNGPQIDVQTGGGELVLDGPDGPGAVDVIHDNGEATFSSTGSTGATVATSDLEGTETTVKSISAQANDLTVDPADKPAVTVGGEMTQISFRSMALDDSTEDFVYTSSGAASVTVNGLAPSETVVASASSGQTLDTETTDASGTATFSVPSGSSQTVYLVTTSAPVINDTSATPAGGEIVSETPVDLNVNVTDEDFGAIQDDSVEVTFYNASGGEIGTDTLSSNGTASVEASPDGGLNEWYATAEDGFGDSDTSSTFSYNAPDELRVYKETQPSQLIDNDTTLRVRFFVDGESEVIERETSDGTVSLTGLPVDERFVVTVRENRSQFTYRRIIIDSLIEQQSAYLLNRSEPNSEVLFQLDDPTGEFEPQETTLYVEKPINKDFDGDGTNETRYETMAGDVFGASAQFPMTLQNDARYRLRVESESGSSRILGFYSVSGDAVERLQIQRVTLEGDADAGASISATLEGTGPNRQLAVRYRDLAEDTERVEYRVINATDDSVIVQNTTRTADTFADIYPISNVSDDASYEVEYEIERAGNVTTGSVYAGNIGGIANRFPGGDRILKWMSWVTIVATMGLLVITNTRVAPIGGTGMAALLTIMGFVTIPGPVLGIAGAISVLVIVGGG
jgi:hypothetical protein